MRIPHLLTVALLVSTVVVPSAACTTMKADARREPLVVPPAPPRVIAPVPEPPSEEPVAQDEPVPPLPRATRPSRETPRTEPKATPADPQAAPLGPTEAESLPKTPPAPGPVAPAPELRTIQTPDDAEATRQVRDTIERAGRTLSGIDYRALPKPSQVQYDMAKRFIEQSEEALKAKNFTAAQLMAEKAATIAKELSGR